MAAAAMDIEGRAEIDVGAVLHQPGGPARRPAKPPSRRSDVEAREAIPHSSSAVPGVLHRRWLRASAAGCTPFGRADGDDEEAPSGRETISAGIGMMHQPQKLQRRPAQPRAMATTKSAALRSDPVAEPKPRRPANDRDHGAPCPLTVLMNPKRAFRRHGPSDPAASQLTDCRGTIR